MKISITTLDRLFSQLVRLRADHVCEHCGHTAKPSGLHCSHFHSRRKRSVRWDLDNAACLCLGCHSHLGGNPYLHTEWFKKRLGSKRFEQLNIRAETIKKWSKVELAELRASLQERIGRLEKG